MESAANNAAGFFPTPPLVKEGVAVGLHHQLDGMALTRVPTGDPAADGALEKTNGIAAVDDGNGAVLGFLPLGHGKGEESTVLGWVGEDPVLGLVRRTRLSVTTYVVQWDYRAATLQPLAAVPGSWVSWAPRLD